MEDQLITFKTAKLAKEKGFNINYINTFYDNNGLDIEAYEIDELNIKEYYSAPTQSLLQRWLREVYHFHIDIVAIAVEDFYIFKIIDLKTRKKLYSGKDHIKYNKFEDCLEEGLQKTLKTIDLYVR